MTYQTPTTDLAISGRLLQTHLQAGLQVNKQQGVSYSNFYFAVLPTTHNPSIREISVLGMTYIDEASSQTSTLFIDMLTSKKSLYSSSEAFTFIEVDDFMEQIQYNEIRITNKR